MDPIIVTTPEKLNAIVREAVAEAIQPFMANLVPSTKPDDGDYINSVEAAALIHRKLPTIYSLVRSRSIPVYKRGGKLLFIKAELQQWVAKGKQKTHAEITTAAKQRNN
ncbi:MAG: helix-turn-helix domain-containing protein [Bacteroidia bacterium]